MKRTIALAACVLCVAVLQVAAQQGGIDMQRARQLFQRSQRGEKLSPDDQAYLDRAKQLRQQQGGKGSSQGAPTGGKKVGNVPPATSTTGLIPLPDMGTATYKGEDGGLYGGGSNEIPADFRAAAEKQVAKIQPLDATGKPSTGGKIVLLTIGMSNTTMESRAFIQKAEADSQKATNVVIVDGAQGGRVASEWARGLNNNPRSPWAVVDTRMKEAKVTDEQVEAVWLKHAEASPGQLGEFPKHAQKLTDDITTTLQILHTKYPNLRIVFLSNRIYAGYATTALNPEPYAYEYSFANRWVIQNQMKGDVKLNFDPDKGTVMAPAVVWGPYLWGDGMKPRKSDGLVWTRADLRDNDGTHPSDSGREKVADLLIDFMHNNPLASSWYLAKGSLQAAR